MRRIIITASLFPLYLSLTVGTPKFVPTTAQLHHKAQYERFVRAIIHVESRGDTLAVGLNNDLGLFQITPIRLQDYNQRTGSQYTSSDMFDPTISRTIFDYYSKNVPFEIAARRWNGGPRGMQKASTAIYWQKVKSML